MSVLGSSLVCWVLSRGSIQASQQQQQQLSLPRVQAFKVKAVRFGNAAHHCCLSLLPCLSVHLQCFLLWFAAQFLFNQSLQLTSVTSNTILSSTSSLFTFALSMVFLKEPYSVAKLASIAACIGGECTQQPGCSRAALRERRPVWRLWQPISGVSRHQQGFSLQTHTFDKCLRLCQVACAVLCHAVMQAPCW